MNTKNGLKEPFYEHGEWLEEIRMLNSKFNLFLPNHWNLSSALLLRVKKKKKKKGFLKFSKLLIFSYLWEVRGSSIHKIPCKILLKELVSIQQQVAKYSC